MNRLWPLLGVLTCLLHAPAARASDDEGKQALLPLRLYVFAMGVVPHGEDTGVPGIGASGFLLLGPFEMGATLTGETSIIGYHRAGLGMHAGLRVPIGRFELDAAATLGGAWQTMDGSFLSDDPGASGSIGFVGGRAGVDYVFHRSDSTGTQASLALTFSHEQDIEPYTVEYTYVEDSSWLWDSEPTVQTGRKRIGLDRTAIMLALGIGFD